MSTHRISLDAQQTANSVAAYLNLQNEDDLMPIKLGNWLNGIGSGEKVVKVRANISAVQADNSIVFASFVDGDTVTINGVTFTGKTSPSGAQQWAVGADDEACANNLVTKLNASTVNKIVGCIGASRRATIALSSFANTDYVTINGVILTGKTSPDLNNPYEFAIGGTDTITAKNLVNCINQNQDPAFYNLTVSSSSSTVTLNRIGSITASASAHATVASKTVILVCLIPGQIGNLCTLAISAHGSVGGANFSNGDEGTQYIFSQNYFTY